MAAIQAATKVMHFVAGKNGDAGRKYLIQAKAL